MSQENTPAAQGGEVQMEVIGLSKRFTIKSQGRRAVLNAVSDVSFTVRKGETFSIVGESGCGKSTLGRCLARLLEPSEGQVVFEGEDVGGLKSGALRELRKKIQFIFQDPYSSMNPRMRVRSILAEPLRNFSVPEPQVAARLEELLRLVSLKPDALDKYPHQFSGGQRQRLVIARALALEPDFIVCDEPVSALDVSVQAQVINLLVDLQKTLRLTYLFISHDLSVVRHLSHKVAVMYLGRMVEVGTRDEIFNTPRHPYTKALMAAVPRFSEESRAQPRALRLSGEIPSPLSPPSGCAFRTRCPNAQAVCAESRPEARRFSPDHVVACHFA
ncbi:ABC transporter ATP-binding protein [Parapusillimonas granuli]|uniref:ATP-binding cassette domain-containing protein n=1 Tax=Parapusillimonas granuli TaxID=380911 RepID=A0A853FW36_9BURK|nr:oligopeptide/dipeptide ABC transporter ATP-binding protein [Parapusillimonas granuli]MBB5214574.1 oligopeptide/dipeptide ABC transporter ATP-binding protein [Parapusillimonas granuli]NYT49018.1 ATP-binding cassette domain-containing protein [Parapusillimonas granuli]